MKQSTRTNWPTLAFIAGLVAAVVFVAAPASAETMGGDNCDAPERFLSREVAVTPQAETDALGGDNCDAPERFVSQQSSVASHARGAPQENSVSVDGDNCDVPEGHTAARYVIGASRPLAKY